MKSTSVRRSAPRGVVGSLALGLMLASACRVVAAQERAVADGGPSAVESARATAALDAAQLEQLVAPIALYPDELLAQVLMASTYPLEIVEADRWWKARGGTLAKDEAATELESKAWDASVKSLVNFPDLLARLSEDLDWTRRLGDAFLAQESALMDAVQRLRVRARDSGKLAEVDGLATTSTSSEGVEHVVIESARPNVVFVPAYDPYVVFGPWPYAAHPPYVLLPYGYWGPGWGWWFPIGWPWAYAWGHCHWHHHDHHVRVRVDVDRSLNRAIDPRRYAALAPQGSEVEWRHLPRHRRGVPYRSAEVARRFGGASVEDVRRMRAQVRERLDAGWPAPAGSPRSRAADGRAPATRAPARPAPQATPPRATPRPAPPALRGLDRPSAQPARPVRPLPSRPLPSRPAPVSPPSRPAPAPPRGGGA